MNKHTPGPWDYSTNVARTEFSINAEQKPMIALCDNEANARLISEAPNLLAACEALLDAYENSEGYSDIIDGTFEKVTRQARAAIAKATD